MELEGQIVSGLEQKKHKKEKEKHRKAFVKLWKEKMLKRPDGKWNIGLVADQLCVAERQVIRTKKNLKEQQEKAGWTQRREINNKLEEIEGHRRAAHSLTVAAAALAHTRSPKKETENPEIHRGIYPQLVPTQEGEEKQPCLAPLLAPPKPSAPMSPPPPYGRSTTVPRLQQPVVTLAGRLVMGEDGMGMDEQTKLTIRKAIQREEDIQAAKERDMRHSAGHYSIELNRAEGAGDLTSSPGVGERQEEELENAFTQDTVLITTTDQIELIDKLSRQLQDREKRERENRDNMESLIRDAVRKTIGKKGKKTKARLSSKKAGKRANTHKQLLLDVMESDTHHTSDSDADTD